MTTYSGYCEAIPFSKGQAVTLPKGTLVQDRKGIREIKRAQTVVVHHTMPGMSLPVGHKFRSNGELHLYYSSRTDKDIASALYGTDDLEKLRDKMVERDLGSPHHTVMYLPVSNPAVVWPGSGGYWVECDINQLCEKEKP